jgi:transposase
LQEETAMPWKESHIMNERIMFVSRLLEGDSMTELCREFGISRKTGYKFKERFAAGGLDGLNDQSRRPTAHPLKTSDIIETLILDLRHTVSDRLTTY